MSIMALAFEPDFQRFLNDLHRGPTEGGSSSASRRAVASVPQAVPQAPAPAGTDARASTGAVLKPSSSANPANPAVLYRRRRIGVLMALIIGLVAVSSLLGGTGALEGLVAPAEASGEPIAVAEAQITHVVQPGDTLWTIVGDLQIEGDVRAAVHAVAEANGGATLVPGQVLTLDAALR